MPILTVVPSGLSPVHGVRPAKSMVAPRIPVTFPRPPRAGGRVCQDSVGPPRTRWVQVRHSWIPFGRGGLGGVTGTLNTCALCCQPPDHLGVVGDGIPNSYCPLSIFERELDGNCDLGSSWVVAFFSAFCELSSRALLPLNFGIR